VGARKRKHPDTQRVTGAMNEARTTLFESYIRKEVQDGAIPKKDGDLFTDVAWTLYSCALRVFQLKLLQPESFYYVEADVYGSKSNEKSMQYFVKVQAKGAEKTGKALDKKQVHPKFASATRKIVQKRLTHTFLFWDFDESATRRFSECIARAAKFYKWPSEHRFKGTHMFRHGAAQDAFVESGGDLFLVQLRTGHLSKKAAQHYALSDLERSAKVSTKDNKQEVINLRIKDVNKAVTTFLNGKFVKKNRLVKSSTSSSRNTTMMLSTESQQQQKQQHTTRTMVECDDSDEEDEFGGMEASLKNSRLEKMEEMNNKKNKCQEDASSTDTIHNKNQTLFVDPNEITPETVFPQGTRMFVVTVPIKFREGDELRYFTEDEKMITFDHRILNEHGIRLYPNRTGIVDQDYQKLHKLAQLVVAQDK
jgi:hypothetical protein